MTHQNGWSAETGSDEKSPTNSVEQVAKKDKNQDCIFIVSIKQKGGTGATEVAAKLSAIAQLANERVVVIDADNGVRSFKRRYSKNSAISVPSVGEITPIKFLKDLMKDYNYIYLDLPGGFASHDDEEVRWLWGLIDAATEFGLRKVCLFVAGSSAEGSASTAVQLAKDPSLGGINIIVLNDNSGSGVFDPIELPGGTRLARFPYMQSGISSAIRQVPRNLADVLRYPARGFSLAAALYCQSLLKLYDEDALVEVLPLAARSLLEQLAEDAPAQLFYTVPLAADATDVALLANAAITPAFDRLVHRNPLTAFAALLRFRRSYRAYRTARYGR